LTDGEVGIVTPAWGEQGAKLPKESLFKVASSAGAWRSRAYSLRVAAETLFRLYIRERDHVKEDRVRPRTFKYFTISQVILLLAGLAIENLVKALWIQKNKPSSDGSLPAELRRHDRNIHLLKSVNVELSPDEIALVAVLQRCVVWAGRYPTPLQAQHMDVPLDFGRIEFQVFRKLYDRLNKRSIQAGRR